MGNHEDASSQYRNREMCFTDVAIIQIKYVHLHGAYLTGLFS